MVLRLKLWSAVRRHLYRGAAKKQLHRAKIDLRNKVHGVGASFVQSLAIQLTRSRLRTKFYSVVIEAGALLHDSFQLLEIGYPIPGHAKPSVSCTRVGSGSSVSGSETCIYHMDVLVDIG